MLLSSFVVFSDTTIVDTIKVVSPIVKVSNSWWSDFFAMFLGSLTSITLVAGFILALFGLYLRWYFLVGAAIKYNTKTPEKFDLKYWWANNAKSKIMAILATVIVIFVSLRFPVEWFGVEVSMGYAFLIGLFFDWFVDFIKNKLKTKLPPYSDVASSNK
jgi:hypothetical protein